MPKLSKDSGTYRQDVQTTYGETLYELEEYLRCVRYVVQYLERSADERYG